MRTASAVGAETETIIGAPMTADFCTISTDTRLVSRIMPSLVGTLSLASAPDSLSSALWRPTSSRRATMPFEGVQKAAQAVYLAGGEAAASECGADMGEEAGAIGHEGVLGGSIEVSPLPLWERIASPKRRSRLARRAW